MAVVQMILPLFCNFTLLNYDIYRQVSFYARDTFLKKSHELNTEFPTKIVYFLG
jgi:hypothetical protein